jgi:O-antigen ligase
MGPLDAYQRGALIFCGALVLVPLIQLVPLPPVLWTKLAWRDLAAQSLTLSGQDAGWRPLSLTPHAAWLSLASLIPPLAVFCATLHLPFKERRHVVAVLLGVGLVASFIGLLQVALGPSGAIVDFGPASPGEATGFFANRNHFAAFLYALLLFAAVFAINSVKALPATADTRPETATLIGIVASFTVVVVLLGAELMARSRAGIGLTMVALLGIAALASSDSRGSGTQRANANRLMAGAVALVLLFGAQFALYRIMDRFAADPLSDARLVFARNTWEAALSFFPFGSGLGSFVPVYQFFEKPQDALVDVYANRAHNEVLEVFLETGVVGLVLMAVFAAWLIRTFWRVWQEPDGDRGASGDVLLARAATLILILLAAHSLVEYPLRTTALMAVSAFACALLFSPVGGDTPPHAPQRQTVERMRGFRPVPSFDPVGVETGPMSHLPEAKAEPKASPPRSAELWAWPDETGSPKDKGDTPSKSSARQWPGVAQRQDLWGDATAWPAAWQKDKADDAQRSGEADQTKESDPRKGGDDT